jgi:hypothetical protein
MDEHQVQVEREKGIQEYLKHLTTLSTGSIVLLSGFLERLFVEPEAKALVGISLVGFTLSVLSCVVAYTLTTFTLGLSWEEAPTSVGVWFDVTVVGAWAGFLMGVIALAAFALANLF